MKRKVRRTGTSMTMQTPYTPKQKRDAALRRNMERKRKARIANSYKKDPNIRSGDSEGFTIFSKSKRK